MPMLMAARFDEFFRIVADPGIADEWGGEVDSPTGYFARLAISEDSDYQSCIEAARQHDFPVDGWVPLAGHYFVFQNSDGVIDVWMLETENMAKLVFLDTCTQYLKWLESDD